jgi:hypothetical protein
MTCCRCIPPAWCRPSEHAPGIIDQWLHQPPIVDVGVFAVASRVTKPLSCTRAEVAMCWCRLDLGCPRLLFSAEKQLRSCEMVHLSLNAAQDGTIGWYVYFPGRPAVWRLKTLADRPISISSVVGDGFASPALKSSPAMACPYRLGLRTRTY